MGVRVSAPKLAGTDRVNLICTKYWLATATYHYSYLQTSVYTLMLFFCLHIHRIQIFWATFLN
jgi:hypothetical protein